MRAVEAVTADPRYHTPDLGGRARTSEVTAAVIEALEERFADAKAKAPAEVGE